MNISVIVNNYVLGARVRITPTHKITSQERIDSRHTQIIYSDVTERERVFIEKALSHKTKVID